MCGSATEAADVEMLMDGVKADMVFTDPPYGIEHSGAGIEGKSSANDFGEILGDDDVEIAKAAYELTNDLYPDLSITFFAVI